MKNQTPPFCFLIIFLISCSVSDNHTNLARENLNTSISSGSSGSLKLDNFEKLNGKEIVIMGAKGYVLEFNATAISQSETWKREDSWRECFSVYSKGGQGGTISLMQGYKVLAELLDHLSNISDSFVNEINTLKTLK